ncbi:MAG: PLP-dependent aminotransferase family protein [Pseudomonadota bacterium]|nr:PLP-dependent aminotransferase family protein [Pseudomonadota bacterium]
MRWVISRIDSQVFQSGARLPSIRALAKVRDVSAFTVAEAYDRLAAIGRVEPRRGSGVYVLPPLRPPGPAMPRTRIDLIWLTQHMLDSGSARGPGLGVLPSGWLDGPHIADALRALGREGPGRWLASGGSHGFAPLREVLQHRLDGLGVVAGADQVVLTTGITQGLDLVLRTLVRPGETVLTLDPSWFGALGLLAAHGANVVSVACGAEGPDLAVLERMAIATRPRLMILSVTAQNPTGVTLSAETVRGLLDIAGRHDVAIFEDDVYADFGPPSMLRFAAADQLRRVIYGGSFSKTLAPNLRVGFLAAGADMAQRLAETKILTGFTTPEINERLLHRLLRDSRYARHARLLDQRVAACRGRAQATLEDMGFTVLGRPKSGIFLWVDTGVDTYELAARAREFGLLIAPGGLFSPTQERSTWTRFNVTTPFDESLAAVLKIARANSTCRDVNVPLEGPFSV